MELPKLLTIILFAVGLAVQAINLAAGGKSVSTYQDANTINSVTTYTDSNSGYYQSVIILSAISVLLYVYLLIVKIIDKSPSLIIDWTVWIITIVFQFGIATVLAVNLKNTKTAYDSYMTSLATLESLGMTSGASYDLLSNSSHI